MLVLTRKEGERFRILTPDGWEVWVSVRELQGNKVRLGVEAPQEVFVDREETVVQKQRDHGSEMAPPLAD